MFDWSLVLGTPFWLGTIPFAFIGWLIAFIGQCVQDRNQTSWWYIFYHLFLLIGVLMVVATDSIRQYRIAVVAFISIGIAYTSGEIAFALSLTILSHAYYAIAAGYIFMAVVMFVWVFAFGSTEDSIIFTQLNSFSVAAKPVATTLPVNMNNGIVGGSQYPTQHSVGVPMGTIGSGYMGQQQPPTENNTSPLNQNADYPYKAKALYAYEASMEDPNELSFTKGETLDIADNKGRWWQARKQDGTVGIAPSNYLSLL